MKLLVIGGGGREHALAWKLAQSPRVQKVYVAPGNGGTATEAGVENLSIGEIPRLVEFARTEQIYLTVVGPEAPLAGGVVDAFRDAGLRIFGPTRAAAPLESSKDFAKRFMVRHRIPTARHATLTPARSAVREEHRVDDQHDQQQRNQPEAQRGDQRPDRDVELADGDAAPRRGDLLPDDLVARDLISFDDFGDLVTAHDIAVDVHIALRVEVNPAADMGDGLVGPDDC